MLRHLSWQFCPRHETALIPGVFIDEAYTGESNLHHTYNYVVYTVHSTNFGIGASVFQTHTQTHEQKKQRKDFSLIRRSRWRAKDWHKKKQQQGNFA